jgi:hypothetical protein
MIHNARDPQKTVEEDKEKRQIISATIDGIVVSWLNNYSGSTTRPGATATPQIVTATINGEVVSWTNNWFGPSTTSSTRTSTATSYATAIATPAAIQLAKASLFCQLLILTGSTANRS